MGESFDIVLIEHGGEYDSDLVILHCSAVRFQVCCKESAPQYGTLKTCTRYSSGVVWAVK